MTSRGPDFAAGRKYSQPVGASVVRPIERPALTMPPLASPTVGRRDPRHTQHQNSVSDEDSEDLAAVPLAPSQLLPRLLGQHLEAFRDKKHFALSRRMRQ